MTVAAVVLAAGGSSRLGQPKQLLVDSRGETLVHKVARDALDAGCHPVCVVVGAQAELVRAAVADLDVLTVDNSDWSHGMSTSIRHGVAAVAIEQPSSDATTGILMLTCDMPSVGLHHLQQLLTEFRTNAFRVASRYGTTTGIPAIFPPNDFAALQSLQGDSGAKRLLKDGAVTPVALPGGTFDLDTPADVTRWRATTG